jgi:hypothetical protein
MHKKFVPLKVWNPCISEPTSCPIKFCSIIKEQKTTYEKLFFSHHKHNNNNFITYNIKETIKSATTRQKTVNIENIIIMNRKRKIQMKNQKG